MSAPEGAPTHLTGSETFLFSDVERWIRVRRGARQEGGKHEVGHHPLLDEAIAAHGGTRLAVHSELDGTIAAFDHAVEAVEAAVAAQLGLRAAARQDGAPMRVRMALHTGEGTSGGDGRYRIGQTLDRGAAICAVGHGGQLLLSAATAARCSDHLPREVTMRDAGWHRLRDLGKPEHVFELEHPNLLSSFPPLQTLDTYRHNLPVQLTPLVGRWREIVAVCGALASDRLLTLTGAAGVGKTRLALAVAAGVLDDFPGGVWWVDLAPLADPDAVIRSALSALGARQLPGAATPRQLAVALGDEPALVVLDNCEHLAEACAGLVAELMTEAPTASVLTTSREPLGVSGEVIWRVPSMQCPGGEDLTDPAELSQSEATVLFVDHAHRARPDFEVTGDNAPAIARTCRRLDGIPLAIELAAARCRQLSPERIADELDDRFRLLTGGARTLVARHQTLLASLDWSHDRLDEAERLTFRRLGVFAGSFAVEPAEAIVAALGGIEPDEVFDQLSHLVDKNLVTSEPTAAGDVRYRLLETMRAYALDHARAAGELTAARDAHATWWADWLEPRGDMPTDDVLVELEENHPNLKAALTWGVERPELGLRILRGVARGWQELGRSEDAITAAERLLTDENAARFPREWLEAASRSYFLYFDTRGPDDSIGLFERVVAVARGVGDEFHAARARWMFIGEEEQLTLVEMARSPRRPLRRGMDVAHAGRELGQRSTAGPPSHAGSGGERRSQQWRAVVPRLRAVRAGGSGGIDGRSRKRHRAQPGGPAWLVLAVLVRRRPDRQLRGAAGSGRGRPSAGRRGLRTLGAHDSRRGRLGPQAAAPPGVARREPVHPHVPRFPAPTRDTLHLLAGEPRSDRRRFP